MSSPRAREEEYKCEPLEGRVSRRATASDAEAGKARTFRGGESQLMQPEHCRNGELIERHDNRSCWMFKIAS